MTIASFDTLAACPMSSRASQRTGPNAPETGTLTVVLSLPEPMIVSVPASPDGMYTYGPRYVSGPIWMVSSSDVTAAASSADARPAEPVEFTSQLLSLTSTQ